MQMWGEVQFLPQYAPETVWWPGSARTRWGPYNAPSDPFARFKGRALEKGKGNGEVGKEVEKERGEKEEGRKGKGLREGSCASPETEVMAAPLPKMQS